MPALAPVLNVSLPDVESLEEVPVEEEIVSVALPVAEVLAPVVVDAKSEECHRMGIPIALAAAPLTVFLFQSPPTTDSETITSTVRGIAMVQRSVLYQGQPVSV
jgi:hypothetical protein